MIQFFQKKGQIIEENRNLKKDLAVSRHLSRHNAATLLKAVMALREQRRENKRLQQELNKLKREMRGVRMREPWAVEALKASLENDPATLTNDLVHDWCTNEKGPMRRDRISP